MKQLKNVKPEFFAVRTSVCAAGKRDGVIDEARVKKWKDAIG
ncbi:MAG: (5-formylfuran-3-yl)methyl phosphate synthase [Gemmataceae bacterium]